MNIDWKKYLLQNGAEQNDQGQFIFDSTVSDTDLTESADIICDLSYFSTVVVAGSDASSNEKVVKKESWRWKKYRTAS